MWAGGLEEGLHVGWRPRGGAACELEDWKAAVTYGDESKLNICWGSNPEFS
jgi:hypothetical protein